MATQQDTNTATSDEDTKVVLMETPQIPIIPFGVKLPAATLMGFDEPSMPSSQTDSMSLMGDNGIVGSIILLNNSVMVWVGWGTLNVMSTTSEPALAPPNTSHASSFGKGIPNMGQLTVAMPRTNYRGMSNNNKDASTSQIIGGANSDDNMLAAQMASRLSTKSNKAVFFLLSNDLSPLATNRNCNSYNVRLTSHEYQF